MAILNMNNVRVGQRGEHVALEVPIGGRPRTLSIDPVAAIQIANQIATAAVGLIREAAPASVAVAGVNLLPYDASGHAHMAVLTHEHGPFVFRLDSTELEALAQAAAAALEFADPSGSA